MIVPPTYETVDHLDGPTITQLADLLERVTDHDGLRPLSEHVWLHVKEGGDEEGLHLLVRGSDRTLIGYAHMDVTDQVEGSSAELAVDPHHRRQGIGTALIEQLLALAPDSRLRLWAHGEQAGASEVAERLGFRRTRVLWQMRRSLYAPLPKAVFPEGVKIRPFVPGVDDAAWLDLNARAFPHLPDQGSWTQADLDRRMREPWFSPQGFLMAWRGERLVGFHWTKVHGGERAAHQHGGERAAHQHGGERAAHQHGGETAAHQHAHAPSHGHSHGHQHAPIGEVYVVGVDPDERGNGLGRALTLAGLHHLRSLDLDQAMLYVDASNSPAIALYEGLGFARWDTDVLYQR